MPRIIYSLLYEMRDAEGRQAELVVPLNADGQSPAVRPLRPKRRVIDLRVGDQCWHPSSGRWTIESITAWRDAHFSVEQSPDVTQGYFVG